MAKELRTPCQCCRDRIASGLWRIYKPSGQQALKVLCAKCGMYDYSVRYAQFGKRPIVRLVKTLGTQFVQHKDTPEADAHKHWVERQVPQEKTIKGQPVSKLLAAHSRRPPTIAQSILDGLRNHNDGK